MIGVLISSQALTARCICLPFRVYTKRTPQNEVKRARPPFLSRWLRGVTQCLTPHFSYVLPGSAQSCGSEDGFVYIECGSDSLDSLHTAVDRHRQKRPMPCPAHNIQIASTVVVDLFEELAACRRFIHRCQHISNSTMFIQSPNVI
jgi:hypothetical protein